jgi:hypothetical protein
MCKGGGTGVESDPIADSTSCNRDIPYFTKLGINTIRVYAVDNTASHDSCMNALAAAGIYLVLDTDTSKYSLNRNDPKESYNSVYLQSVFATIDAFAGYSNVLAFLSGNEVINDVNNTDCAPYVKATTRDMKQYIGSRGYRSIPVGYSAADVASNQQIMAEYMNCGTSDQRSDFYAINDYSWCDPSSFTTSGWDTLVKNYTGYGIPLLYVLFPLTLPSPRSSLGPQAFLPYFNTNKQKHVRIRLYHKQPHLPRSLRPVQHRNDFRLLGRARLRIQRRRQRLRTRLHFRRQSHS